MTLIHALLLIVGALNIIIGFLVLIRDYRRLQNKLFCIFALSLAGWVFGITGFLMTNAQSIAFDWAKAYYSFPLIVALVMPLFARAFPNNERIPASWWVPIAAGYISLAAPLLIFRNFLTEMLVYHEWGKEIVLDKPAYLAYSVYLLSCFGVGLYYMYRKTTLLRGLGKRQAQFFFSGFMLTSFFGVYFNLILPWFGNYKLIWVGPLFTSAFVIVNGYSIIRHRMFDIRLVIARSITYVMSLATLATIYGFLVFGISNVVFNLHFTLGLQIAMSAATGVAALAFNQLKHLYDKATNRLFYRDMYDPQAFFDELNKVVVSTIELNDLLQRVTQTIATHLKLQYCLIGIKDGTDTGQRVIGTVDKQFGAREVNAVRHLTPQMHQTVIVADDLGTPYEKLRDIMIKNDISVLARLTSNVNNSQEGLGYIVLGAKKGGNSYNEQDIKVIEAVANELVVAIQNALHFEEIENFNVTLQEKIDEATRKLRNTNEKLRQMDQTKDDFISMASHQLRTPLTSVKGYVSMVLDGDAGPVSTLQRKLLNQSYVSSQRMVYLISDLLNVSRLRTGKFIIEAIPSNLAKMINEEIEQLQETAKGRNLELIYEKPEHFPTLMLDETKVRQVIMNFIDNAIYYTPSGGHIRVALEDKKDTIEFTVTDDGIGVSKREQPHLFTKFFRAHNAKRARPDGTGLGLFMAKKVIVAQGGALIFKSQEGKGSTFGFTFAKEKLLPKTTPAEPKPLR